MGACGDVPMRLRELCLCVKAGFFGSVAEEQKRNDSGGGEPLIASANGRKRGGVLRLIATGLAGVGAR